MRERPLYQAVWRELSDEKAMIFLYLRNKEKEEVDFLIARDRVPFLLVEANLP